MSARDSVEAVLRDAAPGLAAVELAGRGEVPALILLARSPWLDETTAERLSRNRPPFVQRALAGNPYCPPALLAAMAEHPDPNVSVAALMNPATPFSVVAHESDAVAAGHPDCPADRLVAALDLDVPLDRATVAGRKAAEHPNLPTETLRTAHAWPVGLRVAALGNPQLDHADAVAILATLLPGRGDVYGEAVWLGNRNADPHWIGSTVARHRHDPTSNGVDAAARNPTTPPQVLADLLTGPVNVGRSLAGNPATPATTLARIAGEFLTSSARHWGGPGPIARLLATNPAADAATLALVPIPSLGAHPLEVGGLFDVVAVHATDADQADALLELGPIWKGSVSELLEVTSSITTTAA